MPESDAKKEDGEPVSDEYTLRVPLLPAAVVRQFPLATDLIRAALAPAYGARSPHSERWLDTATGEYCVRLKNDLKPWAAKRLLRSADFSVRDAMQNILGIRCADIQLPRFPDPPEREPGSYHAPLLSPAIRAYLERTRQHLAGWRNSIGLLPATRRESRRIIEQARLAVWDLFLREFQETLESRFYEIAKHLMRQKSRLEDFEREETNLRKEQPCRRIVVRPDGSAVTCTVNNRHVELHPDGSIHLKLRTSKHRITLNPGVSIDGLALHPALSGFTFILDSHNTLTIKKCSSSASLSASSKGSRGAFVEWDIHTHDPCALDKEIE